MPPTTQSKQMADYEVNLRENIQVLSDDGRDANDIAVAITKIRKELRTSNERATRALQVCAFAAARFLPVHPGLHGEQHEA